VRKLVVDGLVNGVHDVAEGGLACTIAEMAVRGRVGCRTDIGSSRAEAFSEAPGRIVLSVGAGQVTAVLAVADSAGVDVTDLGSTGGDRIAIGPRIGALLVDAMSTSADRLADAMGSGTTSG
jgi:phosphoribosylformylglycinamidine synthase